MNILNTHDDYLRIFVHDGQAKTVRMHDDGDLRKILRIAKTISKSKLTISLETPRKSFTACMFKDVCGEYYLSVASNPQSFPLETDFQLTTQDRLIKDIEAKVDVLSLHSGKEATSSMVVASFLVAATKLSRTGPILCPSDISAGDEEIGQSISQFIHGRLKIASWA